MKKQPTLKINNICIIRYCGLLVEHKDEDDSFYSIIPVGSIVRIVNIKETNSRHKFLITLEDAYGNAANTLQDDLLIVGCPMMPLIKKPFDVPNAKLARRCRLQLWYYYNWKGGKSVDINNYAKSKAELSRFTERKQKDD